MKGITRRLALAASGFVLLLGAGSASAVTLPFFLTLIGVDEGVVAPPIGTTVYQLWMDPSAISGGTFGFDWSIAGSSSFRMTAFTSNPAALLTYNLNTTANTFEGNGGDPNNGNFTALELGTLTVNNNGSGPDYGDITLFAGDYVDSNFALQPATAPQVLAAIVPEPGTLALLGVGMGGLAATVRARRRRIM
jgi:hypothetical protein